MPGVLDMIPCDRSFDCRRVSKRAIKTSCQMLTFLVKQIALLQLFDSQCSCHVSQVVFVSRGQDVVSPGALSRVALPGVVTDAVQTHDAHAVGILIIVRGDHSSLTGGDGLGGIKRETRDIANGPYHLAAITRRQGVGRVFYNGQIVLSCDVANLLHFAGLPPKMNRNDGTSARRNSLLDTIGVHVQSHGTAIHEDWSRVEIEDNFGGGCKRERRNQYFIAFL